MQITAGLIVASSTANALTTTIDFKWLADHSVSQGGLGERGFSSDLMFDAAGDYTTVVSDAFLSIGATNGGGSNPYLDSGGDSMLSLNQFLTAGSSFDIGFDTSQLTFDNFGALIDGCKYNGTGAASMNNCEFYVSKIEFSTAVPEPAIPGLLGLGLVSLRLALHNKSLYTLLQLYGCGLLWN